MNTPTKSLIIVLVLIAAAFGVYMLMSNNGPAPLGPHTDTAEHPQPDETHTPVDPVKVDDTKPPQTGDASQISRTEVVDTAPSGADLPQGVKGRVVDSRGAPVQGAKAYLFEGVGNNLFEMMLKMQRGAIDPPLASTETDATGAFALGLREVPPAKVYELRFTSAEHPDKVMPNLTLFSGKWWDAGVVKLDAGAIVEGSVRAEANGAPIAGASVTIQPTGQAFVMGATPGRENGVETTTDTNGHFRFENAPPGVGTVSAAADGFARVTIPNQQIKEDAPTTLDFPLPPGKSIGGTVTDADGKPIRNASIQAYAISAKTPLTLRARTDANGRFSVIGLVDGPYQLDVNAAGYISRQVKPVLAGSTEEVVVLESQKGARIRVTAANGRRVDAYDVDVRRYFPEQLTHGFVQGRTTEHVRSVDLKDGWYQVASLDPGQYVFEVRARGYAKAYSEPFEIAANGDEPEPEREVTVSGGGKITGQVVGTDGRPLAGAAVTTLPNFYEDNAVVQMFGGMVPYQITTTGARTDANGNFALSTLAPGTYQLKVDSADVVTTYQKDVEVKDGETTQVPPIRVETGVVVHGTVRVDGLPAAQVRVNISSTVDPNVPPDQRKLGFSAQTVTDDQGNFVVPKRLPSGRYQATAARQGNPFEMVVDHNKTKQEFSVGAGMTEYTINFQISSQ